MEYKGYRASIDYEEEDNLFVGRVIGLRDSIIFQGRSTKELERNFKDAVTSYLDACKEWGRVPDREYTGHFNLRVPPELHRELAHEAEQKRLSINELMVRKLRGDN